MFIHLLTTPPAKVQASLLFFTVPLSSFNSHSSYLPAHLLTLTTSASVANCTNQDPDDRARSPFHQGRPHSILLHNTRTALSIATGVRRSGQHPVHGRPAEMPPPRGPQSAHSPSRTQTPCPRGKTPRPPTECRLSETNNPRTRHPWRTNVTREENQFDSKLRTRAAAE